MQQIHIIHIIYMHETLILRANFSNEIQLNIPNSATCSMEHALS